MWSGRGASTRRASTLILVGALALAGCASEAPAPVEHRADVDFVGAAGSDAQVDAAALSRLGADLVAQRPGKNTVLSPLSVMLAFAMLREGASGETAAEIDALLGLDPAAPGESVAALRARLASLDGDVSEVDRDEPPEQPLLHVADAMFAAPDAGLTEDFLERVARFHDAGVSEADFRGGRAKPLLDAWVARETGGLMTEAPSDPPRETRLTLLNAVVLAARWQSPFAPHATAPARFTRADGATVMVDTMVGLASRRYVEGPGWRAVELPYTSELAMIVALPDEGAGPITADQWDEVRAAISAQAAPSEVVLWLPSWETDTAIDLAEAFPPLGLERAFSWTGELDGVFPEAFVSGAAHAATITVAEKGTVAAAVTQIDVESGSAPVIEIELRVDRPFDFQIVTDGDMVPVFAGHVADPGA